MAENRGDNGSRRAYPRFDSEASFRIGLEVLREANVPFALAGRLAVWEYVPPEGQQFTKDVGFAVPYGHSEKVAAVARERGYQVTELSIGGFGIRAEGASVDFIDRHPHLSQLFSDAVRVAREQGGRVRIGDSDVPIVPLPYLVAMKLVSGEPGDDRDVEELLMVLPEKDYRHLQELVTKRLGHASTQRLDVLARRAGHPGPGTKCRYKGDAGKDAD